MKSLMSAVTDVSFTGWPSKHVMLAASVISTSWLIAVILRVMKCLPFMRPVSRHIFPSLKPRRTRPKVCFPGKRSGMCRERNEYRCPARERLIWRFKNVEKGQTPDIMRIRFKANYTNALSSAGLEHLWWQLLARRPLTAAPFDLIHMAICAAQQGIGVFPIFGITSHADAAGWHSELSEFSA